MSVILVACVFCLLGSAGMSKVAEAAAGTVQKKAITYSNGDKYDGEINDGKRNGHGIYTFAHGDRYEGEFKEGHFSGHGIYTFADGRRYEGEWKDDKKNGQGIFTWPDGDRYEGEWKDDLFSGHGIYTYADGRRYEGEWKDDKKNGQGIITYANGDRYNGEWKDGKKNGHGIYTWANGNRSEGEWKDGNLQQAVDNQTAGPGRSDSNAITKLSEQQKAENVERSNQLVQAALQQIQAGQYGQAKQLCTQALQQYPNNEAAYDCRGVANYGMGRYEDAINDENNAIRLAPKYAAAWNNLGKAYLAKRNYEALNYFAKAVELAPNIQQFKDDLAAADQQRVDEFQNRYPVGSRVEVMQWSNFLKDYGYAGIVKEYSGNQVTLEVCAFLNVNIYLEAKAASGGRELYKGSDIGTLVTIRPGYITGYYGGNNQGNYNPANRTGRYEITRQYDWGDSDRYRTYELRCLDDGGSATVTYCYNTTGYMWTTFSGSRTNWSVTGISFEQAAVKACKGELN